jgi:membrane protein implicated in regulation of membrane protease activity
LPDIRILIGTAAAAFIISIISGIAVGVTFGVLLFRALLSAAVFTGLSVVLFSLVKAFLPDLLDPSSAQGAEVFNTDRADSGQGLNIVIDEEENPHKPGKLRTEVLDSAETVLESDNNDAFVEEFEEADSSGTYESSESNYESDTDSSDEDVENLEIAEDFQVSGLASENEVQDGEALDKFEGSFESYKDTKSTSSSRGSDTGMNGEDPKILAQAVKTMFKKET